MYTITIFYDCDNIYYRILMFCSDSNPYGINIPIVPDFFYSPTKSVFKRVQKIDSFNNTLQNLNTYNLRITK